MKTDKHKLKVEVVNKYAYPVTAGIETNLMEVYGRFARKGHKITVHTSRNTLADKNVLPENEKINGLTIKRYKYHWYGFIPIINWSNADVVSLHNFNIVPHLYLYIYVLFLKTLGKKKFIFILTPHSGFNPDWTIFPKLQALAKAIYHFTIGTLVINTLIDGIRAISEWEKEEFIKKGINKSLIKVIKNGTQDVAFKNVDKLVSKKTATLVRQTGSYIIQVGRIHPIKNYETPIKALTQLPKTIKLLIVGPDQDIQYKHRLLKLAKKLNLVKRVVFIGSVNDTDKYYLMRYAQLMVHMAIHEGYCNAVHEGMSQGLVCLVSNKTALPYLVKNNINGFCLEPDNFEAVAEKIRFVLANKNSPMIKDIQRKNIQFTKNHSWKNVAKEVEQFYLRVTSRQTEVNTTKSLITLTR